MSEEVGLRIRMENTAKELKAFKILLQELNKEVSEIKGEIGRSTVHIIDWKGKQ